MQQSRIDSRVEARQRTGERPLVSLLLERIKHWLMIIWCYWEKYAAADGWLPGRNPPFW